MHVVTRERRLVVFSLIFAGLLGAFVYLDSAAEKEAQAFCARALRGAPVSGLAADAASIGERRLRHISSEMVQVGFTGIYPFSRYICTIEVQDGRVRGARVSPID